MLTKNITGTSGVVFGQSGDEEISSSLRRSWGDGLFHPNRSFETPRWLPASFYAVFAWFRSRFSTSEPISLGASIWAGIVSPQNILISSWLRRRAVRPCEACETTFRPPLPCCGTATIRNTDTKSSEHSGGSLWTNCGWGDLLNEKNDHKTIMFHRFEKRKQNIIMTYHSLHNSSSLIRQDLETLRMDSAVWLEFQMFAIFQRQNFIGSVIITL